MLLIFVAFSAYSQTMQSTELFGAGDITALPSRNVFINPAIAAKIENPSFQTELTSLYIGFSEDNLAMGSFGFAYPFSKTISAFTGFRYLISDIYSRNSLDIGISGNVYRSFSLGIRGRVISGNFLRNNFIYEPDEAADPLFDENLRRFGFAGDFGMAYKPSERIELGFWAKNIISSNMSLTEKDEDYPLILSLAGAFTILPNIRLAIESSYYQYDIEQRPYDISGGIEWELFDGNFDIRAGISEDFITSGIGINSIFNEKIDFDYAFAYPLTKIAIAGGTSHKIALSINFEKFESSQKEIRQAAQAAIPEFNIKLDPHKIIIDTLIEINSEETFIPAIFFDKNSDSINPRYSGLIDFIHKRLTKNRDAIIELYGFYDDLSDNQNTDLAIKRSKAVADKLNLPEGKYQIVHSGYDSSMPRAGLANHAPDSTQQKMINHENRRVEMKIRLKKTPNNFDSPELDNFLKRNPDLDIAWRVDTQKIEISSILKKNKNRLLIPSDTMKIDFINSSILQKPPENKFIQTKNGKLDGVEIAIYGDIEVRYPEWRIDLLKENNILIRQLARGDSEKIPEKLYFDWKDDSGDIVDMDKAYFIKLSVKDSNENDYTIYSEDSLSINIRKSYREVNRLTLVRFVYDQTKSLESYLQMRRFEISNKIIEIAKKPHKKINILISGHTDTLGTDERNMELSSQRAFSQYQLIRNDLKAILNLPGEETLDDWLAKKNINIEYKGFGASRPYKIDSSRDIEILGDNSLPEGRILNRRVEIEIEIRN